MLALPRLGFVNALSLTQAPRVGLDAAAAALALGACSPALAAPKPIVLGAGADEVWILRPTVAVRDIVVFGHGWSTPMPSDAFAPWIRHLQGRGSIVVYPRYRVGAADSTSGALLAFRAGVVAALHALGRMRVPILALGKSFGASAVFYYAAAARSWGVAGPAAVVSIFPALPVGALPAGRIPNDVYVRLFVRDRDTTAGSGGANAFWSWLSGHPARLKSYVVIHSRPGFVADHDSAQRADPTARAVFWGPVDTLLTRLIRHAGRY